MAAVTYSQGYTRQFFWDGMTTLIAEPDGSPIRGKNIYHCREKVLPAPIINI